MSESYKTAGVDIDAGNEAVDRIKKHAQKTFRPEVKTGIGGFGSLFALNNKYQKPILVSGTDGVGTKLKIAIDANKHDTIGIDLVAMCVNDILVSGAEPLFFLDYIATGKLQPRQVEDIVRGISEGCIQSNCSLIGGETAEMPGMYNTGDYDVAGFSVGIVEEEKIIDGSTVSEGDIIIGLGSNGLHSNGFSLVRHLLFGKNNFKLSDKVPELDTTLEEELLKPTRIYVKSVLEIMNKISVKGMAHITGGGLTENIPRIMPNELYAEIELHRWEVPPIFNLLQRLGNIEKMELYRTFNMGIGFVLIIKEDEREKTIELANHLGEKAYEIGRIKRGNKGVHLIGEE